MGKRNFIRKTGKGLINIGYWYSSKMFGLRAADEHSFLQAEQFTIGTDHLGKFSTLLGVGVRIGREA